MLRFFCLVLFLMSLLTDTWADAPALTYELTEVTRIRTDMDGPGMRDGVPPATEHRVSVRISRVTVALVSRQGDRAVWRVSAETVYPMLPNRPTGEFEVWELEVEHRKVLSCRSTERGLDPETAMSEFFNLYQSSAILEILTRSTDKAARSDEVASKAYWRDYQFPCMKYVLEPPDPEASAVTRTETYVGGVEPHVLYFHEAWWFDPNNADLGITGHEVVRRERTIELSEEGLGELRREATRTREGPAGGDRRVGDAPADRADVDHPPTT